MKAFQSTLTILFTIGLICLGSGSTQADTVFFDDFSDGDAQDGMPVTWTEQPNSGDYDATSGDYVFTRTTNNDFLFSEVVDIELEDFSIRTQVRTTEDNGGAFVSVRVQEPLAFPFVGNYFGGIEYNSNFGGTILLLGRTDEGVFTFFGDFPVLPFDVRTEDAVIQLDVFGDKLELWGWKAGDPMPDQPQLTATDDKYSQGTIRITGETRNESINNIVTFRYVHLADSHIPEPSTVFLAILGMAGSCCYRRRR